MYAILKSFLKSKTSIDETTLNEICSHFKQIKTKKKKFYFILTR